MAIPTTRAEFKSFCLRQLGHPVTEINVSAEQIDDCVDRALIKFHDFHFEGTEKAYYKHQVTANNFPDKIYGLTIVAGGTSYSNSDVLQFTGGGGTAANGTITTNANGTITAVSFPDNGDGFAIAPTVSINTSTGSGANITAKLGGFIPLPANIEGVVNIFPLGLAESGVNSIFNIRYQIALNDLYQMHSIWLPDYYIVRQNIALIEEVLVGLQPIRFNKYRDRVEVDMEWSQATIGSWLVFEAYRRVEPDDFPEIWKDSWLQRYATCLIKGIYGTNLKKFGNLPMVGGITFNGQQIYNEAVAEQALLERELITTWSLPVSGFMG